MHEEILRKFFNGETDSTELANDLFGALVQASPQITNHPIADMDTNFTVKSEHLIKVCEGVRGGSINPESLEAIGFCLVASDNFEWDVDTPEGSLVAETLFDWSEPRINYALTLENVEKFRIRLVTGKDTFKE